MPPRFDTPQHPKLPDPEPEVDLSKRYDVYCSRYGKGQVVYRNVLIKGQKSLFSASSYDVLSRFVELEHTNGDRIFIGRAGIIAFCEHGKNLGAEIIHEC